MKRTAYVLASALAVTLMLIPSCFGQNDVSLADAARAQRKDKQSASKPVIDNDSLPREERINVVGQQALAPASLRSETAHSEQDTSANSDAQAKADDDKTKLTVDPNQSAGDREAVYGQWRKKIADQKDTITLLTRELDVLQREYRLRAAAMYADVGNRLRNANSWDKEDRDYKDKIEAKQKDLDRAKQQLSDMQDQARKAGIPSGVVE